MAPIWRKSGVDRRPDVVDGDQERHLEASSGAGEIVDVVDAGAEAQLHLSDIA